MIIFIVVTITIQSIPLMISNFHVSVQIVKWILYPSKGIS